MQKRRYFYRKGINYDFMIVYFAHTTFGYVNTRRHRPGYLPNKTQQCFSCSFTLLSFELLEITSAYEWVKRIIIISPISRIILFLLIRTRDSKPLHTETSNISCSRLYRSVVCIAESKGKSVLTFMSPSLQDVLVSFLTF